MKDLGRRLREERKRLRFTQARLGAIGGVEANAQGLYEKGERAPRADYLQKVALFGVDILYAVTGNRQPVQTEPAALKSKHGQSSSSVAHPLTNLIEKLQSNLYIIADALYEVARIHRSPEQHVEADFSNHLRRLHADAEMLSASVMDHIYSARRVE